VDLSVREVEAKMNKASTAPGVLGHLTVKASDADAGSLEIDGSKVHHQHDRAGART